MAEPSLVTGQDDPAVFASLMAASEAIANFRMVADRVLLGVASVRHVAASLFVGVEPRRVLRG